MRIKDISLKKLVQILIITSAVSLILLGLVVWVFNIPAYFTGEKGAYALTTENSVTVNVSKTYDPDDIQSIDVDLSFSHIDVIVTEDNKISFLYTGSVISRPEFEEPFLLFNTSLGKLTVKTALPGSFSVANSNVVLKIAIPENKIEDLRLSASSGDITVFGTPSKKLVLDTSSGDIAVQGFTGRQLKSDSSSGDQDYIELHIDDFKASSSSGNITIDNSIIVNSRLDTSSGDILSAFYSSEENYVETTSGEVIMESYTGNIDFSSSSGKLQVEFENEGSVISADTTSGDVILILNRDAGFKISAETTSGDFNIDFPLTLEGDFDNDNINGRIGDGMGLMKISTSSGDISIKSK